MQGGVGTETQLCNNGRLKRRVRHLIRCAEARAPWRGRLSGWSETAHMARLTQECRVDAETGNCQRLVRPAYTRNITPTVVSTSNSILTRHVNRSRPFIIYQIFFIELQSHRLDTVQAEEHPGLYITSRVISA